MKFIVLKGSPIYNQLRLFEKKIEAVTEAARKLTKDLGAKNFARSSGRSLAGGIDALEFDKKPEGYRVVGESWQNLYYPKVDKKNQSLHDKLRELPVIKFKELNDILKFEGAQTVSKGLSMFWVNCPNVIFGKNFILVEVTEGAKYKAPSDLEEIKVSTFEKLKKKAEAEKPAKKEPA